MLADATSRAVLDVYREVAEDRDATAHFADAVAAWQRTNPESSAVKPGLLALLAIESDGIPWIPSLKSFSPL